MTVSTVKTENGNININITQRSSLDCLLDTFKNMKKSRQNTEPSPVSSSAAYLGFGVAYVSLGLLFVMLAIIIAIVQPSYVIFYSNLHFWVGFPFLISGILNLLTYKHSNAFWMALAFMSLLFNFGVSIAGIVITVGDIQASRWRSAPEDVCSNAWYGRANNYEPTNAPRYHDDFYLNICKTDLQRYQIIVRGLIFITQLMSIWGLCLAILDMGCRLRSCCRFCTEELKTINTIPVKTESGNVSCETPEGTVVNININQRSSMLDTLQSQDVKKCEQKTEPPHVSGSVEYLGFGVTYISLGLFSAMLAVLLATTWPYLSIFFSNLHFWVGFPFILSGILNLLTYKFPDSCVILYAIFSLLVNFGVAFAGMFYTVSDIQRFNWSSFPEELCSTIRYGTRSDYEPTRYRDRSDIAVERCITEFQRYKILESGLVIMTLLILIWGLCIPLFAFGYRVWSCCCSCKQKRKEVEDNALIKPNPSDIITV